MEAPAGSTLFTARPSVGRGALLICFAFFWVAVSGAISKSAPEIPTTMLVFFQALIALVVFGVWTLKTGLGVFKTSRWGLHFVRALTGLLSQVLMFISVRKMPLVNAVLLSNSAPLFIPLVSRVWLKTKAGTLTWVSVWVGLAGVFLILNPTSKMFFNPGALIALSSAFFSALALVSVAQLSKTEKTETTLLYYFLISTLIAAPFAFKDRSLPSHQEWPYLLGVGVALSITQLLLILAYHYASASRIAPFNYFVVVFAALIGWIHWHQVPDLLTFLGIFLVTLGGIMAVWFGSKNREDPCQSKS